jgi:hypothetical protein
MQVSFRRLCAWVALVGFLGGFGPILSGLHAPGDDLGCNPGALVNGNHWRTQIEAVVPVSSPEHCALCHLQRSASGAQTSSCAVATWASLPSERRTPPDNHAVRSTSLDQRLSRAPPELLRAS